MKYVVILKCKTGDQHNVFTTTDRQHAACYCKNQNEWYKLTGSPNRYYFEEVL